MFKMGKKKNKTLIYSLAKYSALILPIIFLIISLIIIVFGYDMFDSRLKSIMINQTVLILSVFITLGYLKFAKENKAEMLTYLTYTAIVIVLISGLVTLVLDLRGEDVSDFTFRMSSFFGAIINLIAYYLLNKLSKKNKIVKPLVVVGILASVNNIFFLFPPDLTANFPQILMMIYSLFYGLVLLNFYLLDIALGILEFLFFSEEIKKKR